MTIEREVTIAGQTYPVILSDETKLFRHAKAAGRAIVGLWRENEEKQPADYSSCLYLITDPEDADETFLERVVRRHLALPWLIAETDRLIIREFSQDDPLEPHPLRMPTELFLIGTSARNTGNTSTALPSAVCGRWNARGRCAGWKGGADGRRAGISYL